MGDLDGKVALVVGCGVPGGIGEASARALAEAGAKVVLSDLPSSPLEGVDKQLSDDGLDVAHHDVDLFYEDSIRDLVEFTLATYGRIDVLDNNAAATHLVAPDRDVPTMSVELWDEILAVNLRGPMLVCKHTIPVMVEQGGGSIVNISSGKALAGDLDEPAYSASKAGLNSLTRTIAATHGKQGIRCNTISTGVILTSLMKQVVPEAMEAALLDSVLVPQLGEPVDMANMVVFLASDRARYITGQVIQVDGGILDYVPVVIAVRQLPEDSAHLRPVDE
jgi:NAD(P)-dependent dehydrogenase (short-subunit alcohol dehydrogenase family)